MELKILAITADADKKALLSSELEDNKASDRFISKVIVNFSRSFSEGISKILSDDFDIVMIDSELPDAEGFEALDAVQDTIPGLPILLLCGDGDSEFAIAAMNRGAVDFLCNDELSTGILMRTFRFAVQITNLKEEIERRAIIDELTGLYNRRGFFTLADQVMKLSGRNMKKFALIYADLEDVRNTNVDFGIEAGDAMIKKAGNFLAGMFRSSDIVSRISGDEFAVIAHDQDEESLRKLVSRVRKNIEDYNKGLGNDQAIKLNFGIKCCYPESEESLQDMLTEAEMESQKER